VADSARSSQIRSNFYFSVFPRSTARDIGQTIEAVGAFTTNKKLSAVSIKEFRVARSDLSGYWSLWTAAADTAVAIGSAGGRSTDIGVNTNFLGTTSSSNEGKTWLVVGCLAFRFWVEY
jgi:hypothetical protein